MGGVPVPKETIKPKRAYRRTSETQQIIFDTAMDIMREKGFQGTTVREICASAGIPVGTFYNCYKSKVDILRRIYDEGDAYICNAINREAEGRSAIGQLRVFSEYYARLNERTGIDVLRVLFYPTNAWFSMNRPMQIFIRRVVDAGQRNGEMRRELPADEIIDCLFDILRGICYNWCVCDGAFDLSLRIRTHMDLFCAAIEAK